MKQPVLMGFCVALVTLAALGQRPATAASRWPSDWLMTGINVARNPVYGSGKGTSFVFRADGPLIGQASVANGQVYVGSNRGTVYALDAQSGRLIWHTTLPNMVMNAPVVADGRVFVGLGNNQMVVSSGARWLRGSGVNGVVALSATTGKVLWTVHTAGEVMGGLVLYRGRLYLADGSNHLLALDPASGKVLFRRYDGGIDSMSSLAAAHGQVWAVTGGPSVPALRAFSARTGQIKLTANAPGNTDNTPTFGDQMSFDVYAVPFRSGKTWWFNNIISAFRDGRQVWQFKTGEGPLPPPSNPPGTLLEACFIPFETPPVTLAGHTLYAASLSSGKAYALSARSGHVRWKAKLPGRPDTNPVVGHLAVYYTTKSGQLVALARKTGRTLGEMNLGGGFGPAQPVLVDGTLYVGNVNGRFYAVSARRLLHVAH